MARISGSLKTQKGQNITEFAIILPILLVILIGAIDLGRVFFSTITLVSAAREGARYLASYPEDVSNSSGAFYETEQVTIREADNSGLTLTTGEVTVSCTNTDSEVEFCDSGTPAIVTVTHDFELILGWILPSPITLTRSAQMVVP